jgi:hypothetical protein
MDDIKNLILNGDIKTAVRMLTKQKKHKLALIVAQSVNSKPGMDKLRQMATSMNLQPNDPLHMIVNILTGDAHNNIHSDNERTPWEQ